ncbi:MAG: PilZ domain-containing protein [Elusimicrobia bacterium]|nr:PilZ domain-containing protein [Elusimicrobiota bacterium]
MTGKERRRHKRFDRSMSLSIYGEDREIVDERPTVHNVSRSGFQFETLARLNPSDTIRFDLLIPGKGVIQANAITRWAKVSHTGLTYVYGAEIQGMSWSSSRALKKYLEPGPRWSALFDMILGLALAYVLFTVAKEVQGQEVAFLSHVTAGMGDTLEWAPQAAISAGAIIGIFLFFKDR